VGFYVCALNATEIQSFNAVRLYASTSIGQRRKATNSCWEIFFNLFPFFHFFQRASGVFVLVDADYASTPCVLANEISSQSCNVYSSYLGTCNV